MRRKSEPKGGLSPKTTPPPLFLLLPVKISDKSSPPPPPPLPICFRRRGQANIINPLAPWKQILDRHMHCNSKFEQKSSALYLVEHSYADYCLTYYSNNINTYYMYCADGCCGYSHDRKCCTKIKYDFSASNYNL